MFEYVKLKNFKSFGDVEFNLLDRKGLPHKFVLIYGENGAGKSNLASAFFMLSETLRTMDVRDFLQSMLAQKPDAMADEDFSTFLKIRYKDLETLIRESKMVASDDPMYLEFGFFLNGKSGRYIIETNDTQLIHERLEYTLSKNRGVYFDITPEKISISTKIFEDRKAFQEIKSSCSKFWGKHTLMSIILHESDDKADQFIKDKLSENFITVIQFLTRVSGKIKFGSWQERGFIGLPHGIFRDYDEGIINIEEEPLLEKAESMLTLFFQNTYRDIDRVYYKREYREQSIHYQLMQAKMIAGKMRDIEFSMESTGTQSLLQLLPFMLVVVQGSTAIIDEFDTGVHDLLVQNLVQSLYQNLEGQLIMTTHNTLLLDSGIPKESIYVIAEVENGDREIQCITHYDPKIHANTSIRNQYLKGTYSGIPQITPVNFHELLSELGVKENSGTVHG